LPDRQYQRKTVLNRCHQVGPEIKEQQRRFVRYFFAEISLEAGPHVIKLFLFVTHALGK
jgi:hypothetical protein